MKIKIGVYLLFSYLGLLGNAFAQDSTHTGGHHETREERKERIRAEEHPNALTDQQRAQIKLAEEEAIYKRKMYSFDANLTPAQRRAKILETKKEMMVKIKGILTPQQFANIMIKRPAHVEAVTVARTSGPLVYENREKTLIKTLDVAGDSVKIEFYDNGAVDGDSISVFYNSKLIVQHLMLTERAAGFTIAIDKSNPKNEIVMYAENLGTEPPNTALMVVTEINNSGKTPKHYEVDVSSDLKKSGTVYLRPVEAK